MFKQLRSLLAPARPQPDAAASMPETPASVIVAGASSFDFAACLSRDSGFPLPDWQALQAWIGSLDAGLQAAAWTDGERAWLQHLGAALGPDYRLRESGDSFVLSTLELHVAEATLNFMGLTLKRVLRVLGGIAEAGDWGKDILLVFDDEDGYYRYVSYLYPEDGEFAGSGGMYINAGCGHFATVKNDLRSIEPVIAHEMTHGCLSHLPLPAWLNEGLAVNTEQRLHPPAPGRFAPRQMHERHRAFWGDAEIQQFWSGQSFLRNDDGNMLSYDLARIIVEQLGGNWPAFQAFVRDAHSADAGAAAAQQHLGMSLGQLAGTLLEREPDNQWEPDPAAWGG